MILIRVDLAAWDEHPLYARTGLFHERPGLTLAAGVQNLIWHLP